MVKKPCVTDVGLLQIRTYWTAPFMPGDDVFGLVDTMKNWFVVKRSCRDMAQPMSICFIRLFDLFSFNQGNAHVGGIAETFFGTVYGALESKFF